LVQGGKGKTLGRTKGPVETNGESCVLGTLWHSVRKKAYSGPRGGKS